MIEYHNKERFTNDQKAVVAAFNEQIAAEIATCTKGIEDAYSAIVALPHTNEAGTAVTHGNNMVMDYIASYWVTRLQAMETMLGSSFRQYTDGRITSQINTDARKLMRQPKP